MEDNNKNQGATYDRGQEIQWGGFLNEFLWICAGANRKILRQCPTDYAKYACFGGTILLISILAVQSLGYAFYLVFENICGAVILAVIFGLQMFCINRFLLNTMFSDGTSKVTFQELSAGLPRIIIAILLGIAISVPLELKLYEPQILDEMKSILQTQENGTLFDFDGLGVRISAFDYLRLKNKSVYISSLCITLLITIAETAPIFLKMVIASGSYEDLLRMEKH